MKNIHWRRPLPAQKKRVEERLKYRLELQKVIKAREEFRLDPSKFEALTLDEQRRWGKRIKALDSLLTKDPTLSYTPFAQQEAFHRHEGLPRIEMLICGNRSGKTTPAVVEACWWATGMHPYIHTPEPPIPIWFVCVDNKFAKGTAKKMLESFLPPDTKFHKQDMVFELKNGSEIYIKSQESGRERFQSASIPFAVWDEEGQSEVESERIFGELRTRLVDWEGMVTMAMTMLNFFQWIENLAERAEEGAKDIRLHTWTMRDNPFLPPEEINRFESELGEQERLVRVYGHRIKIGTRTMFDRSLLLSSLEETKDKPFQFVELATEELGGKTRHMMRQSNEATDLRVFQWPIKDCEYIIGADPAGGDGGNPSAVIVLRRDTLEVCAVLRSNTLTPKELAHSLNQLGWNYFQNELDLPALVNPEQNNHGWAVIQEMENLAYPNLWKNRSLSGKEAATAGFRTNPATKPAMEGMLADAIRAKAIHFNDYRIPEELLNYCRNPKTGKTGARSGMTDDLVIALGIALYTHNTEPFETFKIKADEVEMSHRLPADSPKAVWRDALRPSWNRTEIW